MASPTPDAELLPPGLMGRYRARARLGAGGFGRVVLADDLELGRPVAIKLLRASLVDLDLRVRFEREAQLTARLVHPNIVRIFDFGLADGSDPYIVYEYVEGRPLAAAPAGATLGDLRRVAGWGAQVAAALAHAHRVGVLHRDVKPHNILVRSTGGAVLCDFGIARDLSPDATRTKEGIILGTPEYLAPEVIMGGASSAASDQFGLAASLFKVAYGQEVQGGASVAAIVERAIRAQPLTPIPGDRKGILPALDDVILRGLAHDPLERFPDLERFGEALGAAASSSPLPGSLLAPPLAALGTVVVPMASGTGPRTPPQALGVPGGRAVRPAGRAVLAGLAGLALATWWLGTGAGQGSEGPVEPPAPGPPPPLRGSTVETLVRSLGLVGSADPWVLLEGRLRGREVDSARLLGLLEALPAEPRRDFLLLLVRQGIPDPGYEALDATAAAIPQTGEPSGWAEARLRGEALACRLLRHSKVGSWTDEQASDRSRLVEELRRFDASLEASRSPFAAALRFTWWVRLSRVAIGPSVVSVPALEFARRLLPPVLERLGELDLHVRAAVVEAVQTLVLSLGGRVQRQLVLERIVLPALAPLADCPPAREGWIDPIGLLEGEERGRHILLTASLSRNGTLLPLPAGHPGCEQGADMVVEDPPPRGSVRIGSGPGTDPWQALRAAADRARLGFLELEDDPAWRARNLGTGPFPDELLEWPALVLGAVEEQLAAGRTGEAMRLLGRVRGRSDLELGNRHRERIWGAWGRIEALALDLERREGDPGRASYMANDLIQRVYPLTPPLCRSELRILRASWEGLAPADREAIHPAIRKIVGMFLAFAVAKGIE